jgi:hypothetical protein
MTKLHQIEDRLAAIEKRNINVELDKSWETSKFRKILLMLSTYLSIGLYMYIIKIYHPWLNAIIPTLGFLLSTLTLPIFKTYWKNHYYYKNPTRI